LATISSFCTERRPPFGLLRDQIAHHGIRPTPCFAPERCERPAAQVRHPAYEARHPAYASTAPGLRIHGARPTPRFFTLLKLHVFLPVFALANLLKSI
jgi:hypothetical protein